MHFRFDLIQLLGFHQDADFEDSSLGFGTKPIALFYSLCVPVYNVGMNGS